MRAALIANAGDADAGLIGRALRRRGYSFIEFLREHYETWPQFASPECDGIDLVVSMGSSWSTYWDHVAEPIEAEQRLLHAAIDRDIAVLGVCFGAQQLSCVLGGQVTKAQSPEVGWHHISPVTESGHLLPPFVTQAPWMQWHYDRFSVPSGATVLAESAVGPQIMVCGRTLAVQFHPEATESIVRRWSMGDGEEELGALGLSRTDLLAETSARVEDAEKRCDALVEWFLANIAQKHIDTRLT